MGDWTDRNAHDPGITLLEAFVWLAAGLLAAAVYRRFLRRRDP